MRKLKFVFYLNFAIISVFASKKISVITCGRGMEIYSTFGHSAFRIIDSSTGTDQVYNYGLFNFSDPAFVPKFIHGKLDYMLGKEDFSSFLTQYQTQQRWVKEQVLDLSPAEIDSLYQFLEWNCLPSNAEYRYDFLHDNCATKILVVLQKTCKNIKINYYQENPKSSYRQLIHRYAKEIVPFLDWGMDILIGAKVDIPATDIQYTFLPDFVHKTIERSQNSRNGKLVKEEHTIISETSLPVQNPKLPIYFAVFLLILAIFSRTSKQWYANIFRFLFFFVAGFLGVLILYIWIYTEHSVGKLNYNFLWLNPLFLLYSFVQFSESTLKNWIRKIGSACILFVPIAHCITGQNFHAASVWAMVSISIMLAQIKIISGGKINNNIDLIFKTSAKDLIK